MPSTQNYITQDSGDARYLQGSISSNTPTTSVPGDAASAGVSASVSRDDHRHGREAGFGFPHTTKEPVNNNSTFAANRAVFLRTPEGGTISKIAVDIAISSGNLCVGVYRPTGSGQAAAPATRIATSGSVASPGTGYQEISLGGSVAVLAGDYLAVSADNATIALSVSSTPSPSFNNINKGISYLQDTAFPLPATATPSAARMPKVVMIGVA